MKLRTGLFWEVSLIAVHSISVNKLRTFLTLLGIIIGVASVMIVGAGIEGGEQYLITTVSNALGSDSFTISKFPRFGHTSRDECVWPLAPHRAPLQRSPNRPLVPGSLSTCGCRTS